MHEWRYTTLLVAALALCGVNPALAQSDSQNTSPPTLGNHVPDKGDQSTSGNGSSAADPSAAKRDNDNGVIAPPKVIDPIDRPPPSAGPEATPVIPPPGAPGGRQDVQPK